MMMMMMICCIVDNHLMIPETITKKNEFNEKKCQNVNRYC